MNPSNSNIPEAVISIGDLSPDHLIEIIARSIRLITEGEAKYPIKLPAGMASRHRLCTDMANKIKAMGYLGECGYNQLLYPAELTTRSILGFIVEKLPRSEEEAQEEILGPNVLINRRIMASLSEWAKVCTSTLIFMLTSISHQRNHIFPEKKKIQAPFIRSCCPDIGPDGKIFEPRFRVRSFRAYNLNVDAKAPLITEQIPVIFLCLIFF